MSSELATEVAAQMPRVRRYLHRVVRPDEVDDAAQTVVERALRAAKQFEGRSSVTSWLIGIARNVGLEVGRARTRAPQPTEEATLGAVPDAQDVDAAELLERGQTHALTIEALDGLSLDEKLTLLMTYADGLTGQEAAELLGVSFAAYRQRLARARRALAAGVVAARSEGRSGQLETLARWQKLLEPTPEA